MIYRFNFLFLLVEGLFVLWYYLQNRSETQSVLLWGYSAQRLIFLVVVGSLVLIFFLLLLWAPQRSGTVQNTFYQIMDRQAVIWVVFLLLVVIYLTLFLSDHQLGYLASYREALRPLFIWLGLASFQLLAVVFFLRGYQAGILQKHRNVLIPAGIAFASLTVLVAFISITRIGLNPDAIYWQTPGAPVLFLQVLVAWLCGLFFYFLMSRVAIFRSKRIDLPVMLGLWFLACVVWLNQPLTPAYNSLEPRPPNYQSYPFGDAILYDITAHGFLIGKPIPSDFWAKPLYSLVLAFLHYFSGDDFSRVVSLQVVVLALIPIFVYLLVADLGGKPAGLVAAILIILRERNGIALSNVIEISHSKLLMSDVFSMGLMVILTWLLVRWLRQPHGFNVLPFIIGGVISILTLTRGHPVLLLPFVFLILFFMLPRPTRWKSLFILLLGFIIPLLPWFYRNYELTGKLSFQNPISPYSAQIAGLYSMTPATIASPGISDEIDSAYYESLQRQALSFVFEHPGEVVRFITAHYFHNAIASYILLPHSFLIDSLHSYVRTALFWRGWQGGFTSQGKVLFLINVSLIALGIGRVWKNTNAISLIPLLIGIGYNLSVSVGRLSGWRFILPVDWITLVYYSLGLMQFSYILQYSLWGDSSASDIPEGGVKVVSQRAPWVSLFGSGLFFIVISLLLTYGHVLFLQQTPPKDSAQLAQILQADAGSELPSDIEKFIETDQAVILKGEALYPSFFKADTGVLNYYWLSFQSKPYNRFVFYLLGDMSTGVILPIERSPERFPDGAEVIVIGCASNEVGNLDAWAVLVQSVPPVLYTRQPKTNLTCPLPPP